MRTWSSHMHWVPGVGTQAWPTHDQFLVCACVCLIAVFQELLIPFPRKFFSFNLPTPLWGIMGDFAHIIHSNRWQMVLQNMCLVEKSVRHILANSHGLQKSQFLLQGQESLRLAVKKVSPSFEVLEFTICHPF